MMDIIVARILFPNDPTHNNVPHQLYVAEYGSSCINVYSVSSILGKEKRVYGADTEDYEKILAPESAENAFKSPSFVDCTKMYQIPLDDSMDIEKLSHRTISDEVCNKINSRIERKKSEGKHVEYAIGLEDFKTWNPRVKKD